MQLNSRETSLLRKAINQEMIQNWDSPTDILADVNAILDGEMIGDKVSTKIDGNQIIIDLQENIDLLPFILKVFTTYGFEPIQKPGDNKSYVVIDIPQSLKAYTHDGAHPGMIEAGKKYIAAYDILTPSGTIQKGDIFMVSAIRRPGGQYEISIKGANQNGTILLDADDQWEHEELT